MIRFSVVSFWAVLEVCWTLNHPFFFFGVFFFSLLLFV